MNLLQMNDQTSSKLLNAKLVTYSPFGGARDLAFTISDLSTDGITFKKHNGKEQTAKRAEVEFVSDNWEAYKASKVTRAELKKKSFNTSYLFAVLHYFDLESRSGL